MGNIQATEGGKSGQKSGGRSKMRLLGGKKVTKIEEWTSVVPEDNKSKEATHYQRIIEGGEACTLSSESKFILPLTPVGSNQESFFTSGQYPTSNVAPFAESHSPHKNEILTPAENGEDYHSFSEVFQPLNVFKLNEHRARIEQEKASKLSKLGVTTTSQISLEGDGTGFSTGVLEVTENAGVERVETCSQDEKKGFCNQAGPPAYRRHMSVPIDVGAISDVVNMQKAPSLTRAELEDRLQRPKFVPEKLDFRLYEKFEGYMLVNWYLSELSSESPARKHLGAAELKLLASQFCTHLLAAGVLKQLPDPGVAPTNVFRPDCIYFWSHAEAPQSELQTPGKLGTIFWPPTSPTDGFVISPKDVEDNLGCEAVSLKYQEIKSSARDVEIFSLEEEIKCLRQEVDKYKTLVLSIYTYV